MAITALTLYQDNRIGTFNAMAIHSPLVFLIDADYTAPAPDFIYCDIFSGGEKLITARCIYVADISESSRRFRFVADEILRGYMPEFDDEVQTGGSVMTLQNVTKEFTLTFKNDEAGTVQISILIDAIHAARQVGQTACMSDVCSNNNTLYIGFENKPVYVYFYISESSLPVNTSYALDCDDDIFVDYDDGKFVIEDI